MLASISMSTFVYEWKAETLKETEKEKVCFRTNVKWFRHAWWKNMSGPAELTESEDMLLHPQTSLKHMHTHIDMQTNKHLKHETNINCDIYKNMF